VPESLETSGRDLEAPVQISGMNLLTMYEIMLMTVARWRSLVVVDINDRWRGDHSADDVEMQLWCVIQISTQQKERNTVSGN